MATDIMFGMVTTALSPLLNTEHTRVYEDIAAAPADDQECASLLSGLLPLSEGQDKPRTKDVLVKLTLNSKHTTDTDPGRPAVDSAVVGAGQDWNDTGGTAVVTNKV
ncbi:hypothetical protein Bbelb_114580 [Branchiostoma belcheri]|nr:hypothetical protein Bbelb_114580 [Branchiostoma belcheri]